MNSPYILGQEERITHPGYNSIDYLVPFFPLKTNIEMYHTSDTFGYQYDDTSISSNSAGSLLFASHTLLVCGIMVAYVTVFWKF